MNLLDRVPLGGKTEGKNNMRNEDTWRERETLTANIQVKFDNMKYQYVKTLKYLLFLNNLVIAILIISANLIVKYNYLSHYLVIQYGKLRERILSNSPKFR